MICHRYVTTDVERKLLNNPITYQEYIWNAYISNREQMNFIMIRDIANSVTLLNYPTAVINRESHQDMRCQGTTHTRKPHTRPYRWQRWSLRGLPGRQGQQPGIVHILKKFGNVLSPNRKSWRSRWFHKQRKQFGTWCK